MRLLTLFKLRVRMDVDQVMTWAVTALAIGLAIGYQVLGRRAASDDDPTDAG